MLLLALLSACAWYGDAQVAVYGPYRGAESRLATRVAEQLREMGYTDIETDTENGRVTAISHYADNRRRRGRFVFRCFRGGWVQLRVEGPLVHERARRHDSVVNGLRDEYVELAATFGLAAER